MKTKVILIFYIISRCLGDLHYEYSYEEKADMANVSIVPKRNKRQESNEEEDVLFKLADLTVEQQLINGNKIYLEAYKTTENDAILNSKDESKYGKLQWVSLGYPKITKNSNDLLFYFSTSGFHTKVDMLTDYHKELFVKKVKSKYNITINKDQITTLVVSKFTCKMELNCNKQKVRLEGSAYDFKDYPIKMSFNYDRTSELEKDCIKAQITNPSNDIEIKCEVFKNSKKIKQSTLVINLESSNNIDLVNQLFGPLTEAYITRQQIDDFSSRVYSSLNIYEQTELTEEGFKVEFVDDLINQVSDHVFKQVPFQEALNGISKFNIEDDIKPDVITSEFSKLFDVKSQGGKQHIIANKEQYEKINERKNEEGSGSLSGSGFGVQAAASFSFVNEKQRDWEQSGKSLNDQLNELNKAADNTIEWRLEGNKIVPKSISVAKINKIKFKKDLLFRRIKVKLIDHLFSKKFSLMTKKYEKVNNLVNFRETINKINHIFEGVILAVSSIVIDRYFDNGKGTQVYDGWYLCNGQNNTPDLRKKFLVGLDVDSSEYSRVGQTGGMERVSLSVSELARHNHHNTEHSHNINLYTNSAGDHSHTYQDIFFSENPSHVECEEKCTTVTVPSNLGKGFGGNDYDNSGFQFERETGHSQQHKHFINGNTNAANVKITETGDGRSHENRPPFFVVAYIIYLG